MNKITCKHDREADVLIQENGKVACPNLDTSKEVEPEYYPCALANKPCGYCTYKSNDCNSPLALFW